MNLHDVYNSAPNAYHLHNVKPLSQSTLECLSRLSFPDILPLDVRGRVQDYCIHKDQTCLTLDKPSFGLDECLAQASISPTCPSNDDELQLLSQVLATAYTRHKYRQVESCKAQSSAMLQACIACRGSPDVATDILMLIDALLHSVHCITNPMG